MSMYEFFFGRFYCFQGVPAFTHSADTQLWPPGSATVIRKGKKQIQQRCLSLKRWGLGGTKGLKSSQLTLGIGIRCVCVAGAGAGNPGPAESELSTELTHPQPLPRSPNGSRVQEGTLLISLLLPVWELCLETLSLLLPITYPDRGLVHGS